MPVPQSRNPPLVKSRHLVSVAGVATAAANDTNPACLVEAAYSSSNNEQTILPTNTSAREAVTESIKVQEIDTAEMEDDVELEENGSDDLQRQMLNAALAKRLNRNERLDNRRYHTAGAIEDIKKQDVKNNSIHKRLSWNYGQQPNQSGSTNSSLSSSRLIRSGLTGSATNSDSMLSFSSSGVSSTGSLHLSTASEIEDLLELEPDLSAKVHVSTTYISSSHPPLTEATNINVHHYHNDKQDLSPQTHPPSSRPTPPPPPTRSLPVPAALPLEGDVRLDVSEVCDGISSVQITVSGADCSSNASSPTVNGKTTRADLIRMKDLILGDTTMEASEV